jgi:hypothetical protein
MPEHVTRHRMCGFGCGQKATVYGGYAGANDWACYSCDECAAAAKGFSVWEKIEPDNHASAIAARIKTTAEVNAIVDQW